MGLEGEGRACPGTQGAVSTQESGSAGQAESNPKSKSGLHGRGGVFRAAVRRGMCFQRLHDLRADVGGGTWEQLPDDLAGRGGSPPDRSGWTRPSVPPASREGQRRCREAISDPMGKNHPHTWGNPLPARPRSQAHRRRRNPTLLTARSGAPGGPDVPPRRRAAGTRTLVPRGRGAPA